MNTRRIWRSRAERAASGLERAAMLVGSVLAAAFLAIGERRRREAIRATPRKRATADERTIRRIAEKQAGGISTAEGVARYERGENPGGLHHKAKRPLPDAEVFEIEEPAARTETHRGTRRTMASTRR